MHRQFEQRGEEEKPASKEPSEKSPSEEAVIARLKAKLTEKISDPDPARSMENYGKAGDFADHLKTVYPDCSSYRLYHLLGFSTPETPCPKFDFPGEDSVEKFIDAL